MSKCGLGTTHATAGLHCTGIIGLVGLPPLAPITPWHCKDCPFWQPPLQLDQVSQFQQVQGLSDWAVFSANCWALLGGGGGGGGGSRRTLQMSLGLFIFAAVFCNYSFNIHSNQILVYIEFVLTTGYLWWLPRYQRGTECSNALLQPVLTAPVSEPANKIEPSASLSRIE